MRVIGSSPHSSCVTCHPRRPTPTAQGPGTECCASVRRTCRKTRLRFKVRHLLKGTSPEWGVPLQVLVTRALVLFGLSLHHTTSYARSTSRTPSSGRSLPWRSRGRSPRLDTECPDYYVNTRYPRTCRTTPQRSTSSLAVPSQSLVDSAEALERHSGVRCT